MNRPNGIGMAAAETPADNAAQASPMGAGAAKSKEKPANKKEKKKPDSQATRIVRLFFAGNGNTLWHSSDAGYATAQVGGHVEHWPIRSKGFKRMLSHTLYCAEKKPPSATALEDALTCLEGHALFDAGQHPTAVRLAQHDHAIYLDLADERWRAVRIDDRGWRVVESPPVRFLRPKGLLPLPEPTRGGTVGTLRSFVNCTDEDWPLVAAWLLAALRPAGPYPLLVLHGEQGSAKSSTARALRALVDPNAALLRCEPKEPRDLMIAATNGWTVALDNLSHVPAWLSDALCRLSTGGGFSTRMLYTDSEEMIFDAMRPIIATGIEQICTRSDLLDRALLIECPRIDESRRMSESEVSSRFRVAAPSLLGAVLDAVSAAMARLPQVRLDRLPRMADFATWATAGELALGLGDGEFMASYAGNRDTAHQSALESSPIAKLLLDLMANRATWTGTATDLFSEVEYLADDRTRKQHGWPKSERGLSGVLRRLAPNLRGVGIDAAFSREPGGTRRRLITIARTESTGEQPSLPSLSRQTLAFSEESGADCWDANRGRDRTRDDGRDGINGERALYGTQRDGRDGEALGFSASVDRDDCWHEYQNVPSSDGRVKCECRLCGKFYGYVRPGGGL
jgi:hypothetical protein